MSEIIKGGKDYMGYDYKEVAASDETVSLLLDCYQNFGWHPDEHRIPARHRDKVVLMLKRDRRILNKMELTRLQRHFEGCLEELAALKKAKTSMAMAAALSTGILGTVFMACSTFAVTAETPRVLLCILFAVPGFAGWILPVFLYKKLVSIKTKQLEPLVEEKYEEIYTICEKGSSLL